MAIGTHPGISSQAVNTNTTLTSTASTIAPNTRAIQGELTVSNYTTGTYVIDIQVSYDAGTTWTTKSSSLNITANGTYAVGVSVVPEAEIIDNIRIKITSTNVVTTGATIEGQLFCERI